MIGLNRFLITFCCLLFFKLSPAHAEVKVGTVYFDPPFVMSTGVGFDTDFTRVIFQHLKMPYQLISMNYKQLFTHLDRGQIDLAVGGISIANQQMSKYLFSLPYMLSKGQFLTLNANNIKSMADLKGGDIGVIRGQEQSDVFYNYLLSHYKGQFDVVEYNDMEDIMSALTDKHIRAAFLHRSTANFWQQNGGNQFQTLGEVIQVGDGIAFMALPKNQALINQINEQIKIMEKDGSYMKLYNTYFANE